MLDSNNNNNDYNDNSNNITSEGLPGAARSAPCS